MIEEREHRRRFIEPYLKVSYADSGYELGRAVDISSDGLRICGREPIQTNRTLIIRLSFPADSRGREAMIFNVEVVWCARANNADLYHTGVRFLDPTWKQAELIDNLLEIAAGEDRWIPILERLEG
jgi:hypothetical protein